MLRSIPCLLAALVCCLVSVSHSSAAPNILVIIADDLGHRDVGWHGSEIKTPVLDKLAAGGVDLARNYVYPTCSPTRCGIFTGRNPGRFGIAGPIGGRSEQALPTDTMTLARVLKSRGYRTAHVAKWHLGLRPEVGPTKYGFDQSYGYLHGQIDPIVHDYKNGDRTWHRNEEFIDEPGHVTDLLAEEAVRLISAKSEQPLFLWLAFSVPHHPLLETGEWTKMYEGQIADRSRPLFAAAVSHMDAAIGRVVEALEKAGQLDNTLIVFTSDNGGQRGWSSKTEYAGRFEPQPTLGNNLPLRDWKGSLYEGGVRVPACVYWRGKLQPRVVQRPVTIFDWLPTLSAVAGVETKTEWQLDGRNVWPLLSGESGDVPPATMYWKVGNGLALLHEDHKLIVRPRMAGKVELFDLARDPNEERDLAATSPAEVTRLRALLEAQQKLDPRP